MLSHKKGVWLSFRMVQHLSVFRGAERGVTLVETLVALALMGIIAAAFLGGLATVSKATFIVDEQAMAENLARSQMESVKSESYIGYANPDHGSYGLVTAPDGTWTGDGQCKLIKVGATLSVGYDYKPVSAALFGDNLSISTPDNQLDSDGAHMLTWAFPKTTLSPTRTQIFYATGSGGLQGDYGWAEATREDVGIVGELSGTLYRITTVATSLDSGETLASLAAEAMLNGGDLSIISWRINPQEE